MSPVRTTGGEVLSSRQLNRASLSRQLLLERSPIGVTAAVEQVGGLNAQEPNPPYLALWSRLEDFTRESLFELVEQRALVRSPVVRGTQRLVSADDLRWMRPALAPTLAHGQRSTFARLLVGLELDQLVEHVTAMLHERPRTGAEIRKLLVERFPGYDRSALAYSAQYLVATVAMPEISRWGNRKRITHALAEDWIGRPLDPTPGVAELVRRYLAAFGPATPADCREWTRVAGLREVFEALRPSLRTFRDESGRELFDLPDAVRPDPDTPAPVRFLPLFDELLMAHADRSRVMTDDVRREVCIPDVIKPSVLVDGMVGATWSLERDGETALVVVRPMVRWSRMERAAVVEEGARLAAFADPDAARVDVRIVEFDRHV